MNSPATTTSVLTPEQAATYGEDHLQYLRQECAAGTASTQEILDLVRALCMEAMRASIELQYRGLSREFRQGWLKLDNQITGLKEAVRTLEFWNLTAK